MLEKVDEKNHKVVFNVIEGDLVEDLYNSFKVIIHVEPTGDGQLAIWTLEFEKMNTILRGHMIHYGPPTPCPHCHRVFGPLVLRGHLLHCGGQQGGGAGRGNAGGAGAAGNGAGRGGAGRGNAGGGGAAGN
ncbi:hypothetical protein OSB04_008732 [Centaurea solstitialis]|uniref:Bet v I/Major latex protein domain-containing protein n=1 Tax=Centaurea solstitialis TaxID=347529 RepID=A0AA38WJT6_9ASTR|nr:hypothetical protein OSB04_008732 [Centaurea solstitialis]